MNNKEMQAKILDLEERLKKAEDKLEKAEKIMNEQQLGTLHLYEWFPEKISVPQLKYNFELLLEYLRVRYKRYPARVCYERIDEVIVGASE